MPARPVLYPCRSKAPATHAAEKDFKKVAERGAALVPGALKQILQIDSALSAPVGWRCEFGAILPIRSELIVFLPLRRVTQDFVSFLDFFELLFRLFVIRIQVGMIFPGELPVCLLDFVFFALRATPRLS